MSKPLSRYMSMSQEWRDDYCAKRRKDNAVYAGRPQCPECLCIDNFHTIGCPAMQRMIADLDAGEPADVAIGRERLV